MQARLTIAKTWDGVVIPEYVYICFQMTFAMITPALIVGAFAERMKKPPTKSLRPPPLVKARL
jgi:Amt family ammonium transporter